MNINLNGWKDKSGEMRALIAQDVIEIMFYYFHNKALFLNDLQIVNIHSVNCEYADEDPCTHYDRSRICLNVEGPFWCQFVHQLSHELCHCSTSRRSLPQKIKWFDEFICCCSSYLTETVIAHNNENRYDYMFPDRVAQVFSDYLKKEISEHIYDVESTQDFFNLNRKNYETDANLIKSHDVYVRKFFESLDGDFSGLTFVGKMYLVEVESDITIELFLEKLLALCVDKERVVIYQICDLFGFSMRRMKDSKIEWVGEIPETWEVAKAKYKFRYKKEIVGYHCDDYERLALTMQNVVKRSKDDNTGLQPDKFETYQILRKDELVFKLIDLQNISTSRVGLSPYTGIVSPAYIILRTEKDISPRYAEKYFYVLWKNQIFNALGDDGVRSNLGKDDLLNVRMPVPPLEEQQRIADFLDSECRKIDGIKADIELQIETLEQYKQSVITEAVTHGLNPYAPMKESGIPWIGEVPEAWKCIYGKYILSYLQKPVRDTDEVITCFRDGEVTLRRNRREDGFTMADKEIGYQGVDIGDLVVHGMDGFAGAIGISDSRGKASPVLNVLNTRQNKKYLMYYLRSMAFNEVFAALSTGIRVRSCDLRWNKLAELSCPVPPLSEQKEIADYLDEKCAQIDELISQKQSQIETLESYKKSLIFEYVTGKKEVV